MHRAVTSSISMAALVGAGTLPLALRSGWMVSEGFFKPKPTPGVGDAHGLEQTGVVPAHTPRLGKGWLEERFLSSQS